MLWRGHFDSNGSEKRLNLVLNGGAGGYIFRFACWPDPEVLPYRVRWERMVEQSFFGNHIRNASLDNPPLHNAVVTNPHSSDNRNTISETNSSWALPPASLRPGRNVVTVVLVSNPPLFDVTLFIDLHKDNMGLEETGDGKDENWSQAITERSRRR